MIRPVPGGWRGGVAGGGLLVLLVGIVALGCRSTSPGGSEHRYASVVVTNKSVEEIRLTAVDVFTDNQYQLAKSSPETLVFEKPGSRMAEVTYGNWLDSRVWVRVKLSISPFGNRQVVGCDVFAVRSLGDKFFEEEQRLTKLSKGPYQRLLNEIRQRLGQ